MSEPHDDALPMPFGPMGNRTRIRHPIILLIGSFSAFYFWAAAPGVVLASMDAAAGKTDLLAPGSLLTKYGLPALGISFTLILLHFLFWTRVVERRPLTSIGMFRGGSFGPYLNGIAYGALFALIVSLAAFVAAIHFGFTMPAMFAGTPDVMRSDVMLFSGLLILVVLVQGGTEEVVFRGWMLSAFSTRTSITLAVLLSSVAFGAFHVDRFFMNPTFAVIFISATIVLGAFLGVWAVQSGSIAGPAGFHGGYNALLFVTAYLDGVANAKPGASTAQIWADMMSPQAMKEIARNIDYIAATQSVVIIGSLIGIMTLLLTGKDRRELTEP